MCAIHEKKRTQPSGDCQRRRRAGGGERLENITQRELADALGVKTASLCNYLNGMPKLTARLAELALSRLEADLRGAAVGRSREDALLSIARAYRRLGKESPELYKAILNLPRLEDDQLSESGRAVMRIFYQVLEQYGLSPAEILHFSRGFRSAMHGFVSLEAAGFFQRKVDAEESYEQMARRFIDFLADRNAPKASERMDAPCR